MNDELKRAHRLLNAVRAGSLAYSEQQIIWALKITGDL
ncbi:hypothetical protein UFOVP607_34 [uncultured Caudovirales phage]|uniref:Uncharacterized protein n=1 Tax=uncultured Caudovirales phage TaxID=2100421 RepID=A0A6J5NB80_9CAUD|nr:hypothetical protein UFOVP607_34 [uncultured Caudovirales phage]